MQNSVHKVDKDLFERIWKIIEELGRGERHFNDMQARYRNMASVWLLATFSAIGFVISKTLSVNIDQLLLITGIAAAGSMGIALLWIVDLLVYHRLLDSCFIEGLILEEKYAWLPQCRRNMMKTQKGNGVLCRIVGFYIGPVVLLIFIGGGSLSLRLHTLHWIYGAFGLLVTTMLGIVIGYLMRNKTENTAVIEERLVESRIID